MSNAGLLLAQSGAPFIRCKTYTYVLQVKQLMPSRMVIVKNVLGNSVSMFSAWVPPASFEVTSPNWVAGSYTQTGPTESVTAAGRDSDADLRTGTRGEWVFAHTWSWHFTQTYAVGVLVGPGAPFAAATADGKPAFGSKLTSVPPGDVVGKTAKEVNWGLMVYSTNLGGTAGRERQIIQVPDTTESGDVTRIEETLKLAKDGGTDSFGTTPTKGALEYANAVMKTVAEGGLLNDGIVFSESLPPDRYLTCNRLYGSILVTDGISNEGNPSGSCQPTGGNWAERCLKCSDCCIFELDEDGDCCWDFDPPGSKTCFCERYAIDGSCEKKSAFPRPAAGWYDEDPGCPDGGPSGNVCPDKYEDYAAGAAENGFGITVPTPDGKTHELRLRTFVIGLSTDVGPCELNHIAYRGRSDASAGDLGKVLSKNPFLPGGPDHTTGTDYDNPSLAINKYCNPINSDKDWYRGPCRPDPCDTSDPNWAKPYHGHYAFFAESGVALADAIKKIVESIGVGDYTTSGPTISSPGPSEAYGLITSAEFPGWRGHVYSYDVANPIQCDTDSDCEGSSLCVDHDGDPATRGRCGPPFSYRLEWDAGVVLATGNNGHARNIYTWDPRDSSGKPIKITNSVNIATLNEICNDCGITSQVVDFIRGNDGNGTRRSWLLGPVVHSAGAIVGPPQEWVLGSGHRSFQEAYASRRRLFWVGASDGMVHAFDLRYGTEVVALLPPDLLEMQVRLYQNYVAKPAEHPVGQRTGHDDFLYGVATSPRFADVYDQRPKADGGLDNPGFRTVLYFGLGPGGRSLHAVDVTHPWAEDTNGNGTVETDEPKDKNWGFGGQDHVRILWSRTGYEAGPGDTQILPLLAGLGETWSIPAVGMSNDANKTFHLVVGSGYIPYSEGTDTQAGRFYMLDPLTGNTQTTAFSNPLSLTAMSGPPFVRNQGFAPSTIWDTLSNRFRPDNPVDEALQPDLHGQLWLLKRGSSGWDASRLPDSSDTMLGQPIYFNTPVAGYPITVPTHNLMVAVSGSFYEESPNVTGVGIGEPGTFTPSIFLIARRIADQSVEIFSFPIAGQPIQDAPSGRPTVLGKNTQATAYPLLLTPDVPTAPALGFFLLYDPKLYGDDCVGRSYLLRVYFNPEDLANFEVLVTDAGLGAASGVAIGRGFPLIAHSFAGEGVPAYFFTDFETEINLREDARATVQWWRELM